MLKRVLKETKLYLRKVEQYDGKEVTEEVAKKIMNATKNL